LIDQIVARLSSLGEADAYFDVPPFVYEVQIPDFTRRQLQSRIGETIRLHTLHHLDGNPAQGGKLTPRLIGFLHSVEREFFDLFCSVDGVGAKKALRAMVRPVQDIARMIENEDAKGLGTLPGIGPATADRIVAKLRRKMPKFALLVQKELGTTIDEVPDVMAETFALLLNLGHNETDAKRLIDAATVSGKKFKDVESLVHAVYQQRLP